MFQFQHLKGTLVRLGIHFPINVPLLKGYPAFFIGIILFLSGTFQSRFRLRSQRFIVVSLDADSFLIREVCMFQLLAVELHGYLFEAFLVLFIISFALGVCNSD